MIAAGAMSLSSLSVLLNALRLRKFKASVWRLNVDKKIFFDKLKK